MFSWWNHNLPMLSYAGFGVDRSSGTVAARCSLGTALLHAPELPGYDCGNDHPETIPSTSSFGFLWVPDFWLLAMVFESNMWTSFYYIYIEWSLPWHYFDVVSDVSDISCGSILEHYIYIYILIFYSGILSDIVFGILYGTYSFMFL